MQRSVEPQRFARVVRPLLIASVSISVFALSALVPPLHAQAPAASQPPAAAPTAPVPPPANMAPPIISPEVSADRRVTVRFRAPNAQKVDLGREGNTTRLPMTKDEKGVWSVTTDPLEPDYYGYSVIVDGVTLSDPNNPLMKPNLLFTQSMVHVPGASSLPWELNNVPHGAVHHQFYHSGVIGDDRDYYVYTPPGYDASAKTAYPVLYLLHGFSDDASGWTSVGRAHVILDNLIAQGKAKPMLIVMTLGYGAPEIVSRAVTSGGMRDPSLRQRNMDKFKEALLTEVIPQVEKNYRASSDKNNRAIAGLSMGGAESLSTGLTSLDKFAWIGAFSSGGLAQDDNFDAVLPSFDAKTAAQLKLLWIACGTEDRLIDTNRKFRQWLTSKQVPHVDIETPGAHTWMVWRRNLAAFAPLLFQPVAKNGATATSSYQ
jgi:enterochelin esterase-like enzyme